MGGMEKVVRIFNSFAEADEADALALARMTPEERVNMFFEIQGRAQTDAAEPRLERVCRVLDIEQS
jgi:hypothetical protein